MTEVKDLDVKTLEYVLAHLKCERTICETFAESERNADCEKGVMYFTGQTVGIDKAIFFIEQLLKED